MGAVENPAPAANPWPPDPIKGWIPAALRATFSGAHTFTLHANKLCFCADLDLQLPITFFIAGKIRTWTQLPAGHQEGGTLQQQSVVTPHTPQVPEPQY